MSDYQQTEEYKKKIEETEKTQAILTEWNPLGNRGAEISDLDNYYTEANDILFHIRTDLHYPRKGDPKIRVQKIVKDVLNEAFYLTLTDSECSKAADSIMEILKEK